MYSLTIKEGKHFYVKESSVCRKDMLLRGQSSVLADRKAAYMPNSQRTQPVNNLFLSIKVGYVRSGTHTILPHKISVPFKIKDVFAL